jgi:uncharacterized protein (TIGR03435 family)
VNLIETARILIARAYNLPVGSEGRILGGPDWLQGLNFYAIQAKIEDSQYAAMRQMTAAQQRERVDLMMQSLLADRFKLKVHFENRETLVYELVVAKGGPKLTLAKDGESTMLSSLNNAQEAGIAAKAATFDEFVHSILWTADPALGGRPVVNQTGLQGAYDFTLRWGTAVASVDQEGSSDAPSLFTAIQEQLGLRLVPSKASVEMIVIDSIDPPTPN